MPAVEQAFSGSVRFAGGTEHPFEAIIFATADKPGLSKLLAGFDTIAEPRGRRHRFGAEAGIRGHAGQQPPLRAQFLPPGAGYATNGCSAARVMLPVSTTRAKYWSWRRLMVWVRWRVKGVPTRLD